MKAKGYKVDVLSTQPTGPQRLLYSYLFTDGKVTCTAKTPPPDYDDGIVADDPARPLYPTDGMKFMEALSVAYSGSMVRATRPVPF